MVPVRSYGGGFSVIPGRLKVVTPHFGSGMIHDAIAQPLNREKGIAVYGGNAGDQKLLDASRRWAEVFAQHGFHIVSGGNPQGIMEYSRLGVQNGGGYAIGSCVKEWSKGIQPEAYDRYSLHDTVTQRFEAPGGFYESAACSLMFPGSFGTRSEAYRIVYDMMAGTTQYPIQRRLVVADLDPEFSQWVRSQFNKESRKSDQFIVFAKSPEEALKVFMDESVPRTEGIIKSWLA